MSDEIMLVLGEDGVARKYDDTWDITIHCESEEEQKLVWEKLNNSNQEDCNKLAKDTNVPCKDTISRQAAINVMCELMHHWFGGDPKDEIREIKRELEKLPPAQPEYEPVKAEDFARTMSNNTIYSFMAWHGEALELMEIQGFVICKKTM